MQRRDRLEHLERTLSFQTLATVQFLAKFATKIEVLHNPDSIPVYLLARFDVAEELVLYIVLFYHMSEAIIESKCYRSVVKIYETSYHDN